jgi:uncharacterized OB-fold protein
MDVLSAPYLLEYGYRRSCGPIIGRFLAALKEGRIEGARTADGRVIVPPVEYDERGAPIVELVAVGHEGAVTTWWWAGTFAWALIRLDGADTALLHRVHADEKQMKTGMRVRARFADPRVGHINDLSFEVAP